MVNTILARAGALFAPVDQHYLFQARQMQALSLAGHIPLVCFAGLFAAAVSSSSSPPILPATTPTAESNRSGPIGLRRTGY